MRAELGLVQTQCFISGISTSSSRHTVRLNGWTPLLMHWIKKIGLDSMEVYGMDTLRRSCYY